MGPASRVSSRRRAVTDTTHAMLHKVLKLAQSQHIYYMLAILVKSQSTASDTWFCVYK